MKIKTRTVVFDDEIQHTEYRESLYTSETRTDSSRRIEGEKDNRSVSRVRQNLYFLLKANRPSDTTYKFITLTYKDNITDTRITHKHFRAFIRKMCKVMNQQMRYVAIYENQQRGAIHYHVIFFNLVFIERQLLDSLWPHGWTNIKHLAVINNIPAYFSKYFSKQATKKQFNKRLILSSHGLKRPQIVYNVPLDNENFAKYDRTISINKDETKTITKKICVSQQTPQSFQQKLIITPLKVKV